jgi:hypothetical protein
VNANRSLSSYKVPPYQQNFAYFDQWQESHRQHQVEAIIAGTSACKGQIISPCGTGKTRIQIHLHIEEMIELSKQGKSGAFCIASHRLSLNRQLLAQLVKVAVHCGLPFDVLYLGSYRCDLPQYYIDYLKLGYTPEVSRHLATTESALIEKFISEARQLNRNVIIASTYDSFDRLKKIGMIDLITFDEAHNTTQDDFTANILTVKPFLLKEYYFTATRKVSGEEGGMNNEDFYGSILFDAFPYRMIAEGEIVSPRMHIVSGVDDQTTNTSNTNILVKNTIEAYFKHRDKIKEVSSDPNQLGAKLLVGCNSISEMERLYHEPDIQALLLDNIKVFAISSNGCYDNKGKCNKEEFFNQLNDLSDAEDALIFNVDMLTEGIDLPSITGVMPFRNLGRVKLIQMVGRALRLHQLDRKKLYGGDIIPCNYKDYVKPYGWLVIPAHLSTIDHYPEMIKLAEAFYSEYRTQAEEFVIQEKFVPIKPLTLDSMIPPVFKDGKEYDLKHEFHSLIDEINLIHFREDMASLNSFRQIEYLTKNMFQ